VPVQTERGIVLIVRSLKQGSFESQTLPVLGKDLALSSEGVAKVTSRHFAVEGIGGRADRTEGRRSLELQMLSRSLARYAAVPCSRSIATHQKPERVDAA
jgi:hypothetical protein